MDKTVCIIQARVGSTRLPNKVLLDLGGMSMLERVVYRASAASWYFDDLIVATGDNKENDIIEDICMYNHWKCIRGSEDDVLDRFYHTARIEQAKHIIRICADSPFIDPTIIGKAVGVYTESGADYVSTMTLEKSYPRGQHVEVFNRNALNVAWAYTKKYNREHVTLCIWNNPDKFKLVAVISDEDYSKYSLDVDTMEDYKKARYLYDKLGNSNFHWKDIIWLLERRGDEVAW
jgi:spore coat polysaccharide biosynthesis protein SpsF (cytidylyltransferase family)